MPYNQVTYRVGRTPVDAFKRGKMFISVTEARWYISNAKREHNLKIYKVEITEI